MSNLEDVHCQINEKINDLAVDVLQAWGNVRASMNNLDLNHLIKIGIDHYDKKIISLCDEIISSNHRSHQIFVKAKSGEDNAKTDMG